jgi:hypothetical protein
MTMKHAGSAALDLLEPLTVQLRALPGMTEKKRGVFYRKSRAFLHFHEDPMGLYADVRADDGKDFDRFDVTDAAGREIFLATAAARLKA